jgi:hypothetical protein
MESVLVFLCIVFFAVVTYGLLQGHNLTKKHLYNCRTIYIPEDVNIDQVYERISGKSLIELQGMARRVGASKKYTDTFTKLDEPYLELKKYIILHTVSEEHIYLKSLDKDIIAKDKEKLRTRVTKEVLDMDGVYGPDFLRDLDIYQATPSPDVVINALLDKVNFEDDSINLKIQDMRIDAGMEEQS